MMLYDPVLGTYDRSCFHRQRKRRDQSEHSVREDLGGTHTDYFHFADEAVEVWRGWHTQGLTAGTDPGVPTPKSMLFLQSLGICILDHRLPS